VNTGAGISTASGIRDYATKSKNTIINKSFLPSAIMAKPSYSHHAITQL